MPKSSCSYSQIPECRQLSRHSEEEPWLLSRGRHYGHLREHMNFTLLKNRTALRQHTSANIVIQIIRLAECTKPLAKRQAPKESRFATQFWPQTSRNELNNFGPGGAASVWPLVPSGSMGVPCRNSHASPSAAATNTGTDASAYCPSTSFETISGEHPAAFASILSDDMKRNDLFNTNSFTLRARRRQNHNLACPCVHIGDSPAGQQRETD